MPFHAPNSIASLLAAGLADADRLAPSALAHIARASLQGGALIAVVWAVCRLAPKLPAAARHWLWTLACLKLIVTLFWASPIAVPVLRPTALPPMAAALPALAQAHFFNPRVVAIPEAYGPPALTPATPLAVTTSATPISPRSTVTMAVWLLIAYVLTTIALFVAMLARSAVMRKLVRGAVPIADGPVFALIAMCAEKADLRRIPAVRVSQGIPGPLVSGLLSPTILLRAGCLTAYVATAADPLEDTRQSPLFSSAELELALTHEMAHIKRGDIWLSIIPTAVRLLFWFHPLAWLAASEFRAATEEACDARTLRITGAQPGDYFRLLLSVAELSSRGRGRRNGAAALGLSVGFHLLRRRLDNLANACGRPVSNTLRIAAFVLTCICVLVMAPFRFTAHARALIAAALPAYGLADLGATPDRGSAANGISNDGTVVGELLPSITRGPGHALLWRNGSIVPIDPLPAYRHSDASGINSNGMVIASAYNYGVYHHAFIWNDGVQPLGSLPGYRFSKACGINDAGVVVGAAQLGRPKYGQSAARAYLWQDGHMRDLGTLGGDFSCAYAIDNKGEVVGKADTARPLFGNVATHAFSWRADAMTDLGTLGGPNSVAYAVNDAGVVAGAADLDSAVRHACLWYHGQISDLGALAPGATSQARAINRLGQAVGSSTLGPSQTDTHAVIWQAGHLIDLNSLLPAGSSWTLEDARGINDHGEIVGMGRVSGRKHAYLLSPTGPAAKR